jgi:hypothetical protein
LIESGYKVTNTIPISKEKEMREIRFVLSDQEEARRDRLGKAKTNKEIFLDGLEANEKLMGEVSEEEENAR